MHFNQIEIVAAVFKELSRQMKAARKKDCLECHQINGVIAGVNLMLVQLDREKIPARPGMGLNNWLACDDTGASSKAIAFHIMGAGEAGNSYPLDAADFGRCHRFLEAVPEAVRLFPWMAKVSLEWAALVAKWDIITASYLQELPHGIAPETCKLIHQAIKSCQPDTNE